MTRNIIKQWHQRFKTMVRYRLLFLISVPIVLTLLALILVTGYWSVTYTWKESLNQVGVKLAVATNSIEILQKEQRTLLNSMVNSYEFQRLFKIDDETLQEWSSEQASIYKLDFITLHSIDDLTHFSPRNQRQLQAGKQETFFQVVDESVLASLSTELISRAEIPILESSKTERRALISRSLIPLFDHNGDLQWIIDGGLLLNNSTLLVDRIRDLIYPKGSLPKGSLGTVTLFLDDLRVSTNVPLNSESPAERAIGTRVSSEVKQRVLIDGERWIDRAYVYDAWYISGYEPIHNIDNAVIGMLYTGYLEWPIIKIYLTSIAEVGTIILIVLIISAILVHRSARDLFKPLEKIHYVVKSVQFGKNRRIGVLGLDEQHELTSLAQQFDNMLDQLELRNSQLEEASSQLELKVAQRTASLHEKTAQLENNIKLLSLTRDKLLVNEKLAALGELTAGIAHEINNPTAVILGNVELLKLELSDYSGDVDEEFDTILSQIDRIRNITRSLLQYSRHGGIQDEVTWQYVNPIIEESVTLIRSATSKRTVSIELSLNALQKVEINRHHLLQVLVNLQMNGVHAMNGEGRIIVTSDDWKEQSKIKGAIITVKDFGCGISDIQLKRIFDPFYTTRRDGTGLGLSVSQSLIHQVGGEISAISKEGEGSTFTIKLLASTPNL
jgi:two-component system NtrC family sensor kinase